MRTEPICTDVITRSQNSTKERWVFAMEDKSYTLCLLAYGQYTGNITEAFFHPWQVDHSAVMHLAGEQVPIPPDVLEEAKQSLLNRLGYSKIDLPEEAKSAAAKKFLDSIRFGIAESPEPKKKSSKYAAVGDAVWQPEPLVGNLFA